MSMKKTHIVLGLAVKHKSKHLWNALDVNELTFNWIWSVPDGPAVKVVHVIKRLKPIMWAVITSLLGTKAENGATAW